MANQIDIAIQPQTIQVAIKPSPVIEFSITRKGTDGKDGNDGNPGAPGAPGAGVTPGGTTDQVLAKNSNADFDTKWVDQTGGGGGVSEELAIAYAIAL